jgi:hypothetical protein
MEDCRVYYGSHGCDHQRGHDGPHECCMGDSGDGWGPADGFYVGVNCFGEDATPDTVIHVGTWSTTPQN